MQAIVTVLGGGTDEFRDTLTTRIDDLTECAAVTLIGTSSVDSDSKHAVYWVDYMSNFPPEADGSLREALNQAPGGHGQVGEALFEGNRLTNSVPLKASWEALGITGGVQAAYTFCERSRAGETAAALERTYAILEFVDPTGGNRTVPDAIVADLSGVAEGSFATVLVVVPPITNPR